MGHKETYFSEKYANIEYKAVDAKNNMSNSDSKFLVEKFL